VTERRGGGGERAPRRKNEGRKGTGGKSAPTKRVTALPAARRPRELPPRRPHRAADGRTTDRPPPAPRAVIPTRPPHRASHRHPLAAAAAGARGRAAQKTRRTDAGPSSSPAAAAATRSRQHPPLRRCAWRGGGAGGEWERRSTPPRASRRRRRGDGGRPAGRARPPADWSGDRLSAGYRLVSQRSRRGFRCMRSPRGSGALTAAPRLQPRTAVRDGQTGPVPGARTMI